MDRVIKFRGKDKAGVWLFGVYCQDEECMITLVNDTYCFIKVIPETVGQFTGFKDIGGDDIYEGDILRGFVVIDKKNKIYETIRIIYSKENAMFQFVSNKSTGSKPLAWIRTQRYKIIGNIHDNPELLGGGNDD